jgi:hypothetical protein
MVVEESVVVHRALLAIGKRELHWGQGGIACIKELNILQYFRFILHACLAGFGGISQLRNVATIHITDFS